MINLEKQISSLIESHFPSFYKEEGPNFIAFVKAYYEWLEKQITICTLDNSTNFNVGDTVTQTNSEGLAEGNIFYKNGNTVYIETTTENVFRCRLYCQEIVPVESSSGGSTYIATTYSPSAYYHSRRLFDYRDLDTTLAKFIVHFKEKYLTNIRFTTASNKNLLIKKAQDLYRSKGSPRAVELFFRLVYGTDAKLYVPGLDVFKLSDGEWKKPVYIEVSRESVNIDYVGKQIQGINSGATAFVDRLIRRKIKSSYVDIFYLSNVTKSFVFGEYITYIDDTHPTGNPISSAPKIIGSLTSLDVILPGTGYEVGDIVDVESSFGQQGKARVSGVEDVSGVVEFELEDGGFGYSTAADVLVSDRVLTISNVSVTNSELTTAPFALFETITQPVINIATQGILTLTLASNTDAFTNGEPVYQEIGAANTFTGVLESSNSSTLIIKYPGTGTFSTALTLIGNTSNAQATISGVSVDSSIVRGQNVTSYYSNGVVAGRGVVDSFYTNSTPYAYTIRVAPSTGNLVDSSNTNYSNNLFIGNTSSPNTITQTVSSYAYVNATANVIGVSNTLILYTSNWNGVFNESESVTQGTANGIITTYSQDGSNAFITVSNTNGVFNLGQTLRGVSSNATANIVAFSTTIGLHDINNTFVNVNSQSITGAFGTTAKVQLISQGSGANFSVGSIDNEEQISFNTDLISGKNTSNVFYLDIALNSTAYGFPKQPSGNVSSGLYDVLNFFSGNIGTISTLTNINPGSEYDIDPFVVVIEPATVGFDRKDVKLDYVRTSTASFFTGEVITQTSDIANGFNITVSGASEGFVPLQYVYQSNGVANTATGLITAVNISSNTGTITVKEVTGAFQQTAGDYGKLITTPSANVQANATIDSIAATTVGVSTKGLIRSANATSLIVKYLTIQSQFTPFTTIVGSSSAATANVISVSTVETSKPVGLNADVYANVVTAAGAVTSLDVVDSGFGYIENDIVSFRSDSGTTGTATVTINKEGTSEGYYNSTRGFLSADKYLFDGTYYQEYSYEILSRLPFNTYADVFKDVMHIAGTNLFGSVLLESTEPLTLTPLEANAEIYSIDFSGISNTENYVVGETVYQSNGTANVFSGKVYEPTSAVITLSTSANTRYQRNTIIYQPNSAVNAASGYLKDLVANTSSNTLTLYLSNTTGTFTTSNTITGTTNTNIDYESVIRVTMSGINNPNTATGSFALGETVTQLTGFVGEVCLAVESEIYINPSNSTITVDGTLFGSNSITTAVVETATSETPTSNALIYQEVTRVGITGNTVAFANGEYIYQQRQSQDTANTLQFVNTAIGRIVSTNSSVITIDNEIGGVILYNTIVGETSGATANVISRSLVGTANALVLAASSNSANVVNVRGSFTTGRCIKGIGFFANVLTINTTSYTTPTSNVSGAINTIKISNTTGTPTSSYSLIGNTSAANCNVVEINLEDH